MQGLHKRYEQTKHYYMNRKQFIQTSARTSILALMVGLVAVFVKRDNIAPSSECGIDFQCKKCNKVKACTLPEGENYKQNA